MNGEHLEAAQRAIGIHIEAKRSKLMALSEVKVLAFDVFATVDDDPWHHYVGGLRARHDELACW